VTKLWQKAQEATKTCRHCARQISIAVKPTSLVPPSHPEQGSKKVPCKECEDYGTGRLKVHYQHVGLDREQTADQRGDQSPKHSPSHPGNFSSSYDGAQARHGPRPQGWRSKHVFGAA